MADIRQQLAMLLGKEPKDIANIRKTSEVPPRVSVIDVTMAITGKNRNHAAEDLRLIIGSCPEVNENFVNWKFAGAQPLTQELKVVLVADTRRLVENHWKHGVRIDLVPNLLQLIQSRRFVLCVCTYFLA